MTQESTVGLKALTLVGMVAGSALLRGACEDDSLRHEAVHTPTVRTPEATIEPELSLTREDTRVEIAQTLVLIDPTLFTDGRCHLKEDNAPDILETLRKLDPELMDAYVDSQLSVCAEK